MDPIKWCTTHPVFSSVVILFLAFSGLTGLRNLQREIFPVSSENKVRITIIYPNAQVKEIEDAVCIKVEEALQDIAEITLIEAVVIEEVATITCSLQSSANIYQVKDEIKLSIDKITTFPTAVEPAQIEIVFNRLYLLQIFLYGDTPPQSFHEMSRQIKKEMLQLTTVKEVFLRGIREEIINIYVDQKSMDYHNLNFEKVITAIRNENLHVSSGEIRSQKNEVDIYMDNRLFYARDFAQIPVATQEDGTQLLLSDIAKITEDFEDNQGIYHINGKYGVMFVLETPHEQDSLSLAKDIHNYISQKQSELPGNMQLKIWENRTKMIKDNIDMLVENAIVGFFLVIVCLTFFLQVRLAFWVAMGIPISFCGGFWVLWLAGGSLNNFSLFGFVMALGMVVDDAIVVGENIEHYHRQQRPGFLGAKNVALPVTVAIITTIAVFVPLLFLPGVIGDWVSQMAIAVIAVLLFSLFESLFILPSHLLKPQQPHRVRQKINTTINKYFVHYLQLFYYKALNYPLAIIMFTISISIFTLGIVQSGRLHFSFFPEINSEYIAAQVVFPPGTPMSYTNKAVQKIQDVAKMLHFDDEDAIVEETYTVVNKNIGVVHLRLSDPEHRLHHSNEIIHTWKQQVGGIPSTTSLSFFTMADYAPGGKPIELHLFSENAQHLTAVAKGVYREINAIEGLYSVTNNFIPGKYLYVPVITEWGNALGISPQDIANKLQVGFAGREVFTIQRNRQEVKVDVQYPSTFFEQHGMESIDVEGRNSIPIHEVVDWKMQRGWYKVYRRNGKRTISIRADINEKETAMEKVIQQIKSKILPKYRKNYPQVHYVIGGQYEENQKSQTSLLIGLQYALICIFITLVLFFRSYAQPLILFCILPLGAIGMIWGHWLLQMPMSIMSILGVVALCGILVNDALVLQHAININISAGMKIKKAIRVAGASRFRAIFLTTITTFFGLLPLLFETYISATPLIQMAISVSFGLFFATFLTLFLVPTLFWYLNGVRVFVHWLKTNKWPSRESVEPAFHKSLSQN